MQSRQRTIDRVLLLIQIPIWIVCFGLSVRSARLETAYPSIEISSAPSQDQFPVVAGFVSYLHGSNSELRVGDRLLDVNGKDLRGAGRLGFAVLVAENTAPDHRVRLGYERNETSGTASVPMGTYAHAWPFLVVSLAFIITALLLHWRAPTSHLGRASSQAFLCAAIAFATNFAGERWVTLGSIAASILFIALLGPLTVRAALLLPGNAPVSGPWRMGSWLFAAMGPLQASATYGFPLPQVIGLPAVAAVVLVYSATLITIITRGYRHADPIGRRQTRWLLLGVYCALAPQAVAIAVTLFDPRWFSVWFASITCVSLLPISMVIAIVRTNLFDIDRLITAIASYNFLAVLLIGTGFLVVPRVAEAASVFLTIDTPAGETIISLLLAAVAVPAHRSLRPRIERIFFAERYAVDQGVADLLHKLSRCSSAQELTLQTGEVLHRLLQPETCVIYGGSGRSILPMYVEGRAVPPALDAEGTLVSQLRERRGPIDLGARTRSTKLVLSAVDRAVIGTLDAEVVVPIWHTDRVISLLFLGRKRSGDIYTPTDMTLLAAVADKISAEFVRFDQAEVIREGEIMQSALRRYVPGAIVDELAAGSDLEAGEREVSVLFVDIRGYTNLSEGRRPEEIFSIVSRYTGIVSSIVRKYGGSVVEFNGDGMMTVFGAPRELAYKERAAVAAAREIFDSVGSIKVDAEGGEPSLVSVGVGVATGPAFVGNIQAVDRLIWSAIGNTTNLAARLEGLTRDLEAAIVIDATTWVKADDAARSFTKCEPVSIRGRSEPVDLYILPLASPA